MPTAAPQMKSSDVNSSVFPSEMLQVTYLCQVCKELARGYHFGAFTCEGCKSFFGRTCKPVDKTEKTTGDAASLLEPRVKLNCKASRSCNVEGKNRTSCKYCRYEKCLRVGMSPQNSRYGRRSKYFKVATALDAHRQRGRILARGDLAQILRFLREIADRKPRGVLPEPLQRHSAALPLT